MVTTIQVSSNLLEQLKNRKMYEKESYEEIIWNLIEDNQELSEVTKRKIAQSEKEFREGKTVKLEDIKKKMKLPNV
jgi:predicted CopG family antitoxin